MASIEAVDEDMVEAAQTLMFMAFDDAMLAMGRLDASVDNGDETESGNSDSVAEGAVAAAAAAAAAAEKEMKRGREEKEGEGERVENKKRRIRLSAPKKASTPPEAPKPPVVTRSGRTVKPKRIQ